MLRKGNASYLISSKIQGFFTSSGASRHLPLKGKALKASPWGEAVSRQAD
jgi:hypothetical protein